jgi:hypothetical protein
MPTPVLAALQTTALQMADDMSDPRIKNMPEHRERPTEYRGACFVCKDNIDTDQIIPAEYLTLVPTKVCVAYMLSSHHKPFLKHCNGATA